MFRQCNNAQCTGNVIASQQRYLINFIFASKCRKFPLQYASRPSCQDASDILPQTITRRSGGLEETAAWVILGNGRMKCLGKFYSGHMKRFEVGKCNQFKRKPRFNPCLIPPLIMDMKFGNIRDGCNILHLRKADFCFDFLCYWPSVQVHELMMEAVIIRSLFSYWVFFKTCRFQNFQQASRCLLRGNVGGLTSHAFPWRWQRYATW